jgi:hypothetical protein
VPTESNHCADLIQHRSPQKDAGIANRPTMLDYERLSKSGFPTWHGAFHSLSLCEGIRTPSRERAAVEKPRLSNPPKKSDCFLRGNRSK